MRSSAKKTYFLSFCITCNEEDLVDLQKTLIKNIGDNHNYPKLEFIIVDIGAADELATYLHEQFPRELAKKKVVYHRKPSNKPVSYSQLQNQTFKLSSGEIICGLLPNQFTGIGFADYVNECFNHNPDIVLTTIDNFNSKSNYHPPENALSRIALQKKHFRAVGGFDERMEKFNNETHDLVFRLAIAGISVHLIVDFYFLIYIPHKQENTKEEQPVIKVLVNYRSPSASRIIMLYKDHTLEMGRLIDHSRQYSGRYLSSFKVKKSGTGFALYKNQWIKGCWTESSNRHFTLLMHNGDKIKITPSSQSNKAYRCNGLDYYSFDQSTGVVDFLANFNQYTYNKNIFEDNIRRGVINVNNL